MVILIELPLSDLINPMDRVNYVLALDLPQTVKSAQPAAFAEYAKKICMDTITYLGTPQKDTVRGCHQLL